MADILFQFDLTATTTARIIAPIKNMVIAMSTIQSVPSAVDKAASQNKVLFAVYMLLLLVVAFVSWLLWKSGNSLQDAIRDEARKDTAAANAVAAEANERAEKLEAANLTLRGQVATLEKQAADAKKDVATLQKAATDAQTELEEQKGRTATLEKKASDALAAQQQVETTLAEQQQRAAKAEQALLELQERLKQRSLTPEQRQLFVQKLKEGYFWGVTVHCPNIPEAINFAKEIIALLNKGRWETILRIDIPTPPLEPTRRGISLEVIPNQPLLPNQQKAVDDLRSALEAIGLSLEFKQTLSNTPLRVRLIPPVDLYIGAK